MQIIAFALFGHFSFHGYEHEAIGAQRIMVPGMRYFSSNQGAKGDDKDGSDEDTSDPTIV